jgi:hypothetical protein
MSNPIGLHIQAQGVPDKNALLIAHRSVTVYNRDGVG